MEHQNKTAQTTDLPCEAKKCVMFNPRSFYKASQMVLNLWKYFWILYVSLHKNTLPTGQKLVSLLSRGCYSNTKELDNLQGVKEEISINLAKSPKLYVNIAQIITWQTRCLPWIAECFCYIYAEDTINISDGSNKKRSVKTFSSANLSL